jgi:hypothetical protein
MVTAGETVYVEITHRDLAAAQGFYRISAGGALLSEIPVANTVYLPMIIR